MARYIITSPVKGFTGARVGLNFVDGKAETDVTSAIAYFIRHGYSVEDTEGEDATPEAPNEEWTVEQLREHAAAHEVDLGGATKKADILAALTAPQDPQE